MATEKQRVSLIGLLLLASSTAAVEPGKDWTVATFAAAWSPRYGHTSVAYDGKMWIIGGDSASGRGEVWRSSNGITWTLVSMSRPSWRYSHSSVVYGGKMWIIGGYDGRYLNDVWYSTNGTTWTCVTAHAQWSPRSGHKSVVFNGKMWVMGGGWSDGTWEIYNDVWYSTDGASWTEATSHALWPAEACLASVVYDEKMWVIGRGVWCSTNGRTWTAVATFTLGPWRGSLGGMGAVACDGKIWVMGGLTPSLVKSNDVWRTRDGKSWTQATPYAAWRPRQEFPVVVFNRKMWVLGGLDKNSSGDLTFLNDVWYSVLPAETTPAWKLYP